MTFISQHRAARGSAAISTLLYKQSTDLLDEIKVKNVEFESNWKKYILLSKKEFSKIEENYKKSIEDIEYILHVIDKIINNNDQVDLNELEDIEIEIRRISASRKNQDVTSGFMFRVFEILPVITMSIVPSLIQAGFLSLNYFIIASSIAIGVISFIIKSGNLVQGSIDNIKKEDMNFLNQTYGELDDLLRIFLKVNKNKNKNESHEKTHFEKNVLSVQASSSKNDNQLLIKIQIAA